MYKDFYATVGDDKVRFFSTEVVDENTSINEHTQAILSALSSNPSFVLLASISDKQGYEESSNDENLKYFKIMLNEEFATYFSVSIKTEEGEKIAAILSSNPVITSELR